MTNRVEISKRLIFINSLAGIALDGAVAHRDHNPLTADREDLARALRRIDGLGRWGRDLLERCAPQHR